MNIKKIIQEGENARIDFKKTIKSPEKIAKTLVAFANNKGGKLLIGVLDEGIIVGVKEEEEEKYTLEQAALLYCRPALSLSFEEHVVDDKLVLIAEVQESEEKPHYALGEDGKWWVYVRVKDKSLLASKIVVDVLKKEKQNEALIIEFSSNEKNLLEYLTSNERITLHEYCKIQNLSRRKASRILVNLVLSGVIRLHTTTDHSEYYTAC